VEMLAAPFGVPPSPDAEPATTKPYKGPRDVFCPSCGAIAGSPCFSEKHHDGRLKLSDSVNAKLDELFGSGNEPPDAEPAKEIAAAAEYVAHRYGCPSIGGNGDVDCRCGAVRFLALVEQWPKQVSDRRERVTQILDKHLPDSLLDPPEDASIRCSEVFGMGGEVYSCILQAGHVGVHVHNAEIMWSTPDRRERVIAPQREQDKEKS